VEINSVSYNYNQGNRNITTVDDDAGKQRTTGNSELGMNDFMTLLSAQMSNQDMMNPVSDTDFIAQMAQFSALQGVNTLQEYVLSSYAVSYTGKHVIISHHDELTNQLETVYGQVEKVTFMGGTPKVVVNGVEHDLHTVMEIADQEIRPPSQEVQELVGRYVALEIPNESGEASMVFGQVERSVYHNQTDYLVVSGKLYTFDQVRMISDDVITYDSYMAGRPDENG
jgi:flagellar basal-body rod modification protein FlgD